MDVKVRGAGPIWATGNQLPVGRLNVLQVFLYPKHDSEVRIMPKFDLLLE